MRANHHGMALWPGFLLVSVGAGLLARELGLLPAQVRVLDFWPLFIVLIGVSLLRQGGGIVSKLLALAFVGLGGALLAGNLGFLAPSLTRLWPALLVLLGLASLFRRASGPEPLPPAGAGESEVALAADPDRLSRHYIGSGAQLRIESPAWRGGELSVTAGGVELDLRQARLAPDGAVLALRVVMGGVDIRVPDTWQVQCDVTPLLGGADDSTRSTQGATSAPRLRVVGSVTLGGITIQN